MKYVGYLSLFPCLPPVPFSVQRHDCADPQLRCYTIDRPEECAMFALQNPADRAQEGQGPLANPDSYVYFAMGMYYYDRYNIDLSTLTVQEPS